MENAYAPPKSDVGGAVAEATGEPLYSPGQIAAAAFFGTLIAAGWMARANLIALGQRSRGNQMLIGGVVISAVIMALGFVLPDNIPSIVFTLPQVFVAQKLAKQEFEPVMAQHQRRSNWNVFGVCVAVVVLAMIAIVGIGMMMPG